MPPKKKVVKKAKTAEVAPEPPKVAAAAAASGPFAELFEEAVEWHAALSPLLAKHPDAKTFLSGKDETVVPHPGLIFQALKPLPPADWNVIVFGQNPYPRAESATGIAMLDATLTSWEDKRFGQIVSMRNIIKAAAANKYGMDRRSDIKILRQLLKTKKTVGPHKFFSCLLEQGVLLLNASLTASTGEGSITAGQHSKFWQPVVEAIVEEILKQKAASKKQRKRDLDEPEVDDDASPKNKKKKVAPNDNQTKKKAKTPKKA